MSTEQPEQTEPLPAMEYVKYVPPFPTSLQTLFQLGELSGLYINKMYYTLTHHMQPWSLRAQNLQSHSWCNVLRIIGMGTMGAQRERGIAITEGGI